MFNYFRGWKRITGVCMLMLACLLTVGWVRNSSIRDSINIPTGDSSSLQFISGYQCLNLVAIWSSIPDKEMASFRIYRHTQNEIGIHAGEIMLAGSSSPFRPKWPMFGDGTRVTKLMIFSLPYWFVVLPLTAVSSWLLLSKYRAPSKICKRSERTT